MVEANKFTVWQGLDLGFATGDSSAMRALAGPATQVIDAGGRMVLPGLQDRRPFRSGGNWRTDRDAE